MLLFHASSRFVARLYDQKSFAFSHHNINKLRVKLATGRDASLVRLPPSEAALRASFQTKVWHASCLAKPPLPSPMKYGWRTVKDSLPPVYFEGNIAKDQNHVKTSIHIPLQKTFNVLTT